MFFLPYLTKIEFQKFWLVIKFNPFLIKRILSHPEILPSLLVSLCATLHLQKFINLCKIVLLFLPFLFFHFISFNFRVFYPYLNAWSTIFFWNFSANKQQILSSWFKIDEKWLEQKVDQFLGLFIIVSSHFLNIFFYL